MAQQVVIPHVSRIEGHAKITIDLDDAGEVTDARLHVTQLRGFEKFTEGRPYYEMPAITARICGICPVSHLLASVKACDMIMAVAIPDAAKKLRQLLHCAQFVQSHALSFFHLSAPDLLLGMDAEVAVRNVLGLAEKHPELARDGIALRRFGQDAIERMAGQRVHPTWTVPGGVNAPLSGENREAILAELPVALSIARRAMGLLKGILDTFSEEIKSFSNLSTMYAGLVGGSGDLRIYDGRIRFRAQDGSIVSEVEDPRDYSQYIGEASLGHSYLKAPFYKPVGFPNGIYRVGPLARLNAADRLGTREADAELAEFRQRLGRCPQSAFFNHYARLIETIWCLERMQVLLDDPEILDPRVRAHAGVNAPEGVGIIEAPRGILIHHYKVNDAGAITWANLIVATGHNNLAMNYGVKQVAAHFIKQGVVSEGILNRVCAVVRAYDPCLSCSTHADGRPAVELDVRRADGTIQQTLRSRD
jgi:NAD-reducing hydrogenase large subunit